MNCLYCITLFYTINTMRFLVVDVCTPLHRIPLTMCVPRCNDINVEALLTSTIICVHSSMFHMIMEFLHYSMNSCIFRRTTTSQRFIINSFHYTYK